VVISLYYYFGVIRAIYWSKDAPDLSPIPMSRPMQAAVWVCIAGMFWLGLAPGGVLKFAEEKRCDMIVTATHPRGLKDLLSDAMDARKLGKSKIPVLFHHAM